MIADKIALRASQWCYRGVWLVLTNWMKVPKEPPRLDGANDQSVVSFRPAEGFLRYLKFYFWICLVAIDAVLIAGWVAIVIVKPVVGWLLAIPAWALIILPDIVAYVAIHLRYDTTWYVLSDRTMRIRRGIWTIHETTITYENIQNVAVQQGPVERWFGIANIVVKTAGGGSDGHHGQVMVGHQGILEGIDNAEEIRKLVLAKWQSAGTAGLGDEWLHESQHPTDASARAVYASPFDSQRQSLQPVDHWTDAQLAVLRQIRDEARRVSNPV